MTRAARDVRQPMRPMVAAVALNAPDLWDAAARMADERDYLELMTVAAVMGDPGALVPVAKAEGVGLATFDADDYAAFWLAAETAGARGTVAVLKLAERLLKQIPFGWDWQLPPLPPGSRGSMWNEGRLAWLGSIQWPCRAFTEWYAAQLVAVANRADAAAKHLDAARAMLEGSTLPRTSGEGRLTGGVAA